MNMVESVADNGGLTRSIIGQAGSESTGALAVQRKAFRDALMAAEQTGSESGGALATNRKALSEALASAGFVNLVGQWRENFRTFLSREGFGMEVADLKPDILAEIAANAASGISENPSQAQQAQAQVPPEAAVNLLA